MVSSSHGRTERRNVLFRDHREMYKRSTKTLPLCNWGKLSDMRWLDFLGPCADEMNSDRTRYWLFSCEIEEMNPFGNIQREVEPAASAALLITPSQRVRNLRKKLHRLLITFHFRKPQRPWSNTGRNKNPLEHSHLDVKSCCRVNARP